MAEIIIRPLSGADLDAVTGVHCAAFPASAITAFGPGAVLRYYDWQLNGPHDAFAIAATDGGQLIGFCFGGLFNGSTSGFLRKNRAYLFSRLLLRPWLAGNELIRSRIRTGLKLLTKLGKRPLPQPSRTKAKSFGILSIAVAPGRQGGGVGKALLLRCEAAALQMGLTQMHLTVDTANAKTIAVYERLGWIKAEEGGKWKGRMTKQLQS